MSYLQKVKEFSEGARGRCPKHPIPPSKNQSATIVGFIVSECVEFLQPDHTMTEIKTIINNAVNKDLSAPPDITDTADLITEKADALIDAIYYICDFACKHGINLDDVFEEVHSANMRKRQNGEFIKRDDGKILKPEGWYPPDVKKIINKHLDKGSWS